MNPARWQRLDELFHAALEREPDARATFIAEACADDDELYRELESMLKHHDQANSFIESPAYVIAAETIVDDDFAETLVGKTFRQYQILGLLGKGGMGVVYLALDQELHRNVALKFLHDDLLSDKQRVQRFKQEARAVSALNHPNILTIHQIGELDGRQFIATEFVEGETLREIIKHKRLSISETLDIATQIASALSAAHQTDIMHRDIKPENVMVRPDGYVKVLDFGLAKLSEPATTNLEGSTLINTEQGMILGTVQYMSPEQARGLAVDARTDIWSLGVMLYEMVTTHPPFDGQTKSDVIAAIIEREPLPLVSYAAVASEDLQSIVTKALKKSRDERYPSVDALLTDLRLLKQRLELSGPAQRLLTATNLNGKSRSPGGGEVRQTRALDEARPTSGADYVVNKFKRHKLRSILLILALAMLVSGGGIWSYKISRRGSLVQKSAQFRRDMVWIPGGTFSMGREDGKPVEAPAHAVTVASFYIDRTEITNAEYAVFIQEAGYVAPAHWSGSIPPAGQEQWRVTNVAKEDADAFVVWRSKRDGVDYRLLKEEEWEYVARNGPLDTIYPWGEFFPPSDLSDGANEPVGTHQTRANYRGVYDLMGSGPEWTSSVPSQYPGNYIQIPLEMHDWIVFRGYAMHNLEKNGINSATRDWIPASRRHPTMSFRLVRSSP